MACVVFFAMQILVFLSQNNMYRRVSKLSFNVCCKFLLLCHKHESNQSFVFSGPYERFFNRGSERHGERIVRKCRLSPDVEENDRKSSVHQRFR